MFQLVPLDVARERGYRKYFTGIPCRNGHISERYTKKRACVICVREQSFARSQTDKVKEQNRRYKKTEGYKRSQYLYKRSQAGKESARRYAAKEETKAWMADYQKTEKCRGTRKAYRQSKRYKEIDRKWRTKWRRTDEGAATAAARTLIHRCLRATGAKKCKRTHEELGYAPNEFKLHIEAQFLKGMTWDNYGEWHIDHIIPIAKFIADGETDMAVINALTNIRPLWAKDNLKKKDKVVTLL